MQNEINNWQNATILENAGNPIESENILLREHNSIQLISHSNMGVDSMNFEMLNTDFTTSTPHEMITDDVLDGLLQDNLVMDSSSFHQQPQQQPSLEQQSNPLKRSFGQTISPSFHSYSSSSSTNSASYFPPTKKFAAAAPIATINIVGTKTLDGFSNADAYEACVGTCPTDAVSSGAISIPPTPQFIVKVPNLPSLSQQPQQKPIPLPSSSSSIIPNISAIPFSPANSNETSPMMSPILFQQIQGQMQQQLQQAQQQGAAAPRKFTITLNVLTVQKSNDPADAAKPWKCDSPGCTKSFSDRSNLIQHLRTHTEEKPYVCDKCDKCFSHSASLKEHQRIHSSEKPFVCETCQKTFTQQSNFRRHLRIHSGEKPYHCNNCGKDFNQSSNLKQHLILKHGSLANESNVDSS